MEKMVTANRRINRVQVLAACPMTISYIMMMIMKPTEPHSTPSGTVYSNYLSDKRYGMWVKQRSTSKRHHQGMNQTRGFVGDRSTMDDGDEGASQRYRQIQVILKDIPDFWALEPIPEGAGS